jgi:hypothetical protein
MLYSQMCWDYTTICVRVIFAYLGTPRSRKAGLCVRITGWFLLLAHYLQSRIMTSGHGLADFAVLMVFDVEKEVEIKLGGRTDHAHTISKRGSPPLPNFTTLTTTSSDDAPETRQIEYPPIITQNVWKARVRLQPSGGIGQLVPAIGLFHGLARWRRAAVN